MPWQLIYTSAPRGLTAGQSGFCTVARSADLRETLVQRLEQISSYNCVRAPAAKGRTDSPSISAYRIVDLRGQKYHVLTRIEPSGLDFTARTNHLAQHLVFQSGELGALPSPADILCHWRGWLSSWQGEPQILENLAAEDFKTVSRTALPASTWAQVTGDAGRAAGLLSGECAHGCYLLCAPGEEGQLLNMFCETLQLLNFNGEYPLRPWQHTFTTFLQAEDSANDFQWRGCQTGTPTCERAKLHSTSLLPLTSVPAPAVTMTKLAREGYNAPRDPMAGPVGSHRIPSAPRIAPDWKRPPGLEIPRAAAPPRWRPLARETPEIGTSGKWISSDKLKFAVIAVLVCWLFVNIPWGKMLRHSTAPPASGFPPASVPEPAPPANQQPAALQTQEHPSATPQTPMAPTEKAAPLPPELTTHRPGVTYLLVVPNVTNFTIPAQNLIALEALLHKFDGYLPATNITMRLGAKPWDYHGEVSLQVATLDVHDRQLAGTNSSGLRCALNYGEFDKDEKQPIVMQTDLPETTHGFSLLFEAKDMDPLRIVVINENAPLDAPSDAPPVRANYGDFLMPEGSTIDTCLRGDARDWLNRILWVNQLDGQVQPLSGRVQLHPYIRTKDSRIAKYKYIYEGWPADKLPPAWEELNFPKIKARLTSEMLQRKAVIDRIADEAELQRKSLDLNKQFEPDTKSRLATFASFLGPDFASTDRLIEYVLALKTNKVEWIPKDIKKGKLNANPEATFQEVDQAFATRPGADKIVDAETDYFHATWKTLKGVEDLDNQQWDIQNQLIKLRAHLESLPETLDGCTYISLCLTNSKRSFELIRFLKPSDSP